MNQTHLVGISILRAGKDEKRCKIVVLSFAQRHLHLACKPLDSHRRREHRTNIVACCKNGQSQLKESPSHSFPSRDGHPGVAVTGKKSPQMAHMPHIEIRVCCTPLAPHGVNTG